MARRRAEVPHHRVVVLRQQAETRELVHRPRADVGRRDVADVAHVEAQQRPDLGLCEQRLDARQALPAQARNVDALLPVDGLQSECLPHERCTSVGGRCRAQLASRSASRAGRLACAPCSPPATRPPGRGWASSRSSRSRARHPAPGEVLVRVRFSGVNPTDVGARGGHGFDTGHAHVVPDHDGAGEIVEVGDGVPAERIGERVWLWLAQWRRRPGNGGAVHRASLRPGGRAPGRRLARARARASGSPRSRRTAACGPTGPRRRAWRSSSRAAPGPSATPRSSSPASRGARVAATVSSPEKAALASAAGAELVVDYRAAGRRRGGAGVGAGRRRARRRGRDRHQRRSSTPS